MFNKVLIANRGVVAVRVGRTLRKMGIPYVVVYSEADAGHRYVKEADEAYSVGPAPARESYLNRELIIRTATDAGCDAIHPGYGFMAEDPIFAQMVQDAGIRFIGPSAKHIEDMGNKVTARTLMSGAGVPVLPASGPVPEGVTDFSQYIDGIGLPMLIKAAAGGGGIGMQRIFEAAQLAGAVEKTRALSARAFGDGTVYLERYLQEPRHIEFQMIGDGQGNVRSIFERDCSIQRRHQKVIEEAPAPSVKSDIIDAMSRKLVQALADWKYDSLGTVEMLMDRDDNLYFLETNTRLQVEHGVTEAVTGLDLVEAQVRIAAGQTLDAILPDQLSTEGHAIELRIYAEDPVRFFPSPGTLNVFQVPEMPGVMTETHLEAGGQVTPHYDPMLALLIAKGETRDDAIDKAIAALGAFTVEGVKTNIPFLTSMLDADVFRQVRNHTTLAEAFSKTVGRAA
jgi:acetyl-CoA carboxylase, biotin carboxylase subunit